MLTPAAVEIVRTRVDTLVPILAICVLRTSCASHEERSVQLTRVLCCSGSRRRVYGYLAQRRQPAPSHGAPGEEQATRGWQRRVPKVGALLSAGAPMPDRQQSDFLPSRAAVERSQWSPDDALPTYRDQLVRVARLRGELIPQPEGVRGKTGFAADGVAHVIGAWNSGGEPATLRHNIDAMRGLREAVREAGWTHRRCAARDAKNLWAEPGLLLLDAPEQAVLNLARQYGQPAVLRWTPQAREVVSVDGDVAFRTGWRWSPFTVRPCPMQPNAKAPQEVCRDPGGPWISASITASANWCSDRATLMHVLGCAVCDQGAADGPGGAPVLLYPRTVASRYGRPAWLRSSRSR